MNPFAEITMKVSVMVAVALGVVVLLRTASAALRHWVLAVGLACAALTPLLGRVAPTWHMPLARSSSAGARVGTVAPVAVPAVEHRVIAEGLVATTVGSEVTSGDRGATPLRLLGPIWLAGAAISLTVLLVGLARLSWLASRAQRLEHGLWPTLAAEVSRAYGLRRKVLLLQSDHPTLLVTWGFVRPAVILPREAREWSADRVRIVLSHELAHIHRGDWVAQMAAELLRSAHWFNPLIWIACRRLRDESERACDDVVMSCGVEGPEYAAELLDLARALTAQRHAWFVAPAMARSSNLERRVTAMLNAQINRKPIARSTRALSVSALIALALVIGGFSASAQSFTSFSGSVLDQLGGAVGGVTLRLSNSTTGQKYEVQSNPVGLFEFVGLTAGEYELQAFLPGFKSVKSTFTAAGRNVRQDITLRVGTLEETITVVDRGEPRGDAPEAPRVRTGPVPQPKACVAIPGGGRIMQPRKIADVRPIYPRNLGVTKVGGVVVLDALIGTDGTVQDARPVEPIPDPDLVSAAIEAVRQWKYTTTTLNCVPIEVSMFVTVNFRVE